MTWAIDERYVPVKNHICAAISNDTLNFVRLIRAVRFIALRRWASWALVEFCVSVPQLDGDVSEQFSEMTNGILLRDSPNKSGFTVSDVTNRTNVDSGLS